MDYRRATEADKNLIKSNEAYTKRTALVAEENKKVIAVFEYEIQDFVKAKVLNFQTLNDMDLEVLLKGFIDEVKYWNPYLKALFINNKTINIDQGIKIVPINVKDIVPEQLTVDEEKVETVSSWVKSPNDIIITCIKMDGMSICVDGYSRLMVAHKRAYERVYTHYDNSFNEAFIRTCLKWCQDKNINTIDDLSNKVVSAKEHKELWINRCQTYFKSGK